MDSKFPNQLFPHFYLDGPPEAKPKHSQGGWGSYERLFDGGEAERSIYQGFESQHGVRGDSWVPVRPAVTPLIPPCEDARVFSDSPPNPLDFPEQIQYFYQHHCMDAFSTMGNLLQDQFSLKKKSQNGVVKMGWAQPFLKGLKYRRCQVGYYRERVRRMHHLLGDIVSDIPQSLLAKHLHEELTLQREQKQFCSDMTGGALGYMPLYRSQSSGDGCLIYPSSAALDTLNFHRVVPEYNDDKPPSFFMDSQPIAFKLQGTIRQLSLGNMEDVGNVGVRSDYFCSVWLLGDNTKPRTLEVIQTKDRFSCVTVSPHIPDELVVATERGAAYLWTVRKGLQKFREEDSNLYFNAKSSWRWCEFSSHPRVMVYADRTGAEITDTRNNDCYHTLFRIGKTPACMTGERVILTKYLGESHAHHHLITTQFSAYIMDERVPCVPMLKWDHMMESQPVFACVMPALTRHKTCKVLLGAQRSQEVMLLQYMGGRTQACQTQGPIQKLLSPTESLSHLNIQLPHRRHHAQKRLNAPAAGLTAIQNKDFLSVFQLTETGDLFYQTLRLHAHQTAASDLPEPAPTSADAEHTEETGERGHLQSTANDDGRSSHSDSEGVTRQRVPSQLEVFNNVDNDVSDALDTNEEIREEARVTLESSSRSNGFNPLCTNKPPKSETESMDPDLQVAWNRWLKPLFKKAAGKKRYLRHQQIKTKGIINLKITKKEKLEEECLKSLRSDLQEVMRKKEMLLQGVTHLPSVELVPVPETVDSTVWPDDVSQRLTASWGGEWKSWWEERLGLNRDKKIEALRVKRRREKQARARSRVSLSGSFTSSVSYQDDLSGWSSATSQDLGSDAESLFNSQPMGEEEGVSETEMHRRSPAATIQTPVREPVKSALRTPQRTFSVADQVDSLSKSQTSFQIENPTKSTSILTSEQEYESLTPSFHPLRPTLDSEQYNGISTCPIASSTQLSSISLSSQRIPQVRAPSQASQPKKKKSRMGF